MKARAIWGIILLPLWLAGCGFQPIYADNPQRYDIRDALNGVQISTPVGREGELLRAELLDHLNPESRSTPLDFMLKIAIQSQFEPFIIEPDGTASRYRITITSPYTLTRMADDTVIAEGEVRRQVSYNVSEDDDYSTFVAQQDALKRVVVELAEDYKLRISALMARERGRT